MSRCSFPRKAQRDRSYARSAREFLGCDRGCGAHPVDQCGTRNDVPAIRVGMESDPYGDDGDLRGVSHRRCRRADIVWRHLRYIGRRATILIGLTSSLLGTALFAVAPSVLWVFVGRAFMGLGVGLCAGSATAAMVEFSAAGQETRAGSITTVAQAIGIALATIVGGALIQYAPYPTHLNFWVLFAVLAILFAAAWLLPRTVSNKAPGHWQPKLPTIPGGIRMIFAASAIAATSGYVIGGVMFSLGAQIAHDLVGSDNALVNGVAIALFALAAGAVAVPGKRLRPPAAIIVGGLSAIVGMAMLALSTTRHALAIFVAAATAGGIGRASCRERV